jgi:hypothetical protein
LRTFYYPVFKGASVDTCILIASKTRTPGDEAEVTVVCSRLPEETAGQPIRQRRWRQHPEKHFDLLGSGPTQDLLDGIRSRSFPLGDIATAYFGIQTFDRTRFVTERRTLRAHKPAIDGVHIQRYDLHSGTEFVDFRPASIKSGGKAAVYESERIGVRQIGKTPIGTILPRGVYSLNTIYNVYFTRPTDLNLRFVLGLIASSTGRWFWAQCFFDQKETFPKIKKDALLAFPVISLDFSSPADRARHDKMVSLVDKMLALVPKLRAAKSEQERKTLQNAVDATDRQIDELVYELYGLTPEEIALVERESK